MCSPNRLALASRCVLVVTIYISRGLSCRLNFFSPFQRTRHFVLRLEIDQGLASRHPGTRHHTCPCSRWVDWAVSICCTVQISGDGLAYGFASLVLMLRRAVGILDRKTWRESPTISRFQIGTMRAHQFMFPTEFVVFFR
ncbi:hypothetical protein F4809DRAFT_587481 [Biscogniauxia mediterranea]|nr:hypothetical protein F4809DRAFT_587481 [Biscogniauxia mediterranea]